MELQNCEILVELKCQNCENYLYPPISICSKGHSMCEICRGHMKKCYVCQAVLDNVRNIQLESIISKFKVPCKNRTTGCGTFETTSKISAHHDCCAYGIIPCPLHKLQQCMWRGTLGDLLLHATDTHPSEVVNKGYHRVKGLFTIKSDIIRYSLICAYKNTFRYCFKVLSFQNIIGFNVQFVGPQPYIVNYSYVITFIDIDNPTKKHSILSPCDTLGDEINTTYVSYDKLKQFCSPGKNLYFQLEIIATNCIKIEDSEDEGEPNPKRLRTNSNSGINYNDLIEIDLTRFGDNPNSDASPSTSKS